MHNDGVHPSSQQTGVQDVGLEFAALSHGSGHNGGGGGSELHACCCDQTQH